MAKTPPYLKEGDTIGLICPSGYMPFEKMQTCITTLEAWGFHVRKGNTVNNQYNYFSGTDEERLADLQQMLDDEIVKAVFCARGGYGLSRIIDRINFDRFKVNSKWIVGYSDVTLLHAHILSNLNIASLHAPMAAAFNEIDENRVYIDSIYNCLTGKQQLYKPGFHFLNRDGVCEGELVGGNLAMLIHLLETNSDIDTKNKILFLEDIGEYKYNIDRMLMQLKRANKLKSLAGLIVGSFSDTKDTSIPFGREVYDLIFEKIQEDSYPVCFDFPVGHTGRNYALKIGVKHRLKITQEDITLEEIYTDDH